VSVSLTVDSRSLHFTAWIEHTDFSTWIRESPSLLLAFFPTFLIVHAFGMAFPSQERMRHWICAFSDLPRESPCPSMNRFFPVLWFGFIINLISGLSAADRLSDQGIHESGFPFSSSRWDALRQEWC